MSAVSNARGRVRPVSIVGPTASGKTAAAYELAKRIGAEIISVDSMAVYRGMNVGTAKPSEEDRRQVPFHMIDVVDPDEPFSVADFQEQASKIVDELLEEGIVPLVVGGTGLYVRALLDGLNIPGPGPDPEIRTRLENLAKEKGNVVLHKELRRVDRISAGRLHPNDLRRIIRALEVHEQTGSPMSEIIEQTKPPEPRYSDALFFGLTMDRANLYRRIEERVDRQLRDGLREEVAGLIEKGYNTSLPSMQGLGYKELAGCMNGLYDAKTAVYLLKRNTRRFAKRQFTWFRADARIEWIDIDGKSPSAVADCLEERLREEGIVGQDVGQPVQRQSSSFDRRMSGGGD